MAGLPLPHTSMTSPFHSTQLHRQCLWKLGRYRNQACHGHGACRHGRGVRVAAGNLVEGHLASSPALGSGGASSGAQGSAWVPRVDLVEGQPATAVSDNAPLQSVDDMTAFVERTRVEEEAIRRKREEVELQLLRMRQQEAVRRQQAIRMRVATDQANAAALQQQQQQQQPGTVSSSYASGASSGSNATSQQQQNAPNQADQPDHEQAATMGEDGAPTGTGNAHSPAAGVAGAAGGVPSAPGTGPPKKKLMLKRSKRMSAVAAAAGLHRVMSPGSPATGTPATGAGLASLTPVGGPEVSGANAGGGAGKALLSREEIIKNSKERRDVAAAMAGQSDSGSDSECALDECLVPKPIFIISDCTGESAARTVRAALNQFQMRCRTQAPAQIMIFRFVESVDKVLGIIQEAAKEDALVVYTLVDPQTVKAVQTACTLSGVRYVDLWSTLLDTMEVHLNAVRSGVPASLAEARQKVSLNDEYFRMIEAVEYTRKMDDGAHPQEWAAADLLILGVSRCGKTPLSIYLGQRGYKVANLPLIPGCPVPRELFSIDQTRIVGLIIDPHVLASIRRNRVSMMGVARAQGIDYAEIQKINSELEWARKLYNAHPEWPVLDVTLRGIEETAARILKLLNDRRGDASPKWVEEYHAKPATAAAAAVAQAEADTAAARGEPGAASGMPELIYGANESTFMMQGLY